MSKILFDAGADSTAANGEGDSILQILIRRGKTKSARILIECGTPDLEHANKSAESVIHTVVLQKESKILEQVIRKGIDISRVMPDKPDSNVQGGSALHLALQLQSKKCVKIILDEMKESNLKIAGDDGKHSALDICLRNQWHDIGEELLELGAQG